MKIKLDKSVRELGGNSKSTFDVEIGENIHTINKQKFVMWMFKNEIIEALKSKPDLLPSWGLVSYQGVPLNEFSKEEIIRILGFAHTKDFELDYPNED